MLFPYVLVGITYAPIDLPAKIPRMGLINSKDGDGWRESDKGVVMILKALGWSLLLFSIKGFATVSFSSCPEKFIATVVKIEKDKGPEHAFATNSVELKTEDVLKGRVEAYEKITIPRHGTFDLKVGEKYILELHNHKVCQIHAVNEEHGLLETEE